MSLEPLSFDVYHPNPLFLVVSGPSGVGKDALLHALVQRYQNIHMIVTAASREPREGEVNGRDYFFVSKETFEAMIAGNQLIEHSIVYGEYKGIPRDQVEQAFASGKDVIIRVDVQGAEKLKALFPDAVLIFLVPHDEAEWRLRLENRKSESEETYRRRVDTARYEMTRLHVFDYVVVNAHARLDDAVDTLIAIIDAEHHRVVPRKVSL